MPLTRFEYPSRPLLGKQVTKSDEQDVTELRELELPLSDRVKVTFGVLKALSSRADKSLGVGESSSLTLLLHTLRGSYNRESFGGSLLRVLSMNLST